MNEPREEALEGGREPGGEVAVGGPTVKDDEETGGAGEAAGLLEIETHLQVNPEVAAAKELDPSLLLSPIGRLEAWMALLPHTTTELLEELGGGYLFLISGDALMIHLLRKQHLDADVKKGFQPLRLLYQAERLLKRLETAGAHYKIVFFRAFTAATEAHPLFCMMQQLLQLHFAKQGIDFLTMSDWWGPSFASAIASLHPLFILIDDIFLPDISEEVYDAEGDDDSSSDSDSETDEEEVMGIKDPREMLSKAGRHWSLPPSASLGVCQLQLDGLKKMKQRGARCMSFLFQSLCLSCCRLGIDIAFLQRLVVKPTKVFAPSVSCYTGANLWRVMESLAPSNNSNNSNNNSNNSNSNADSNSNSNSNINGDKGDEETPGAAADDGLQRALELHSNMLRDLDLLPPSPDEAQQEEAAMLLLQQLQEAAQQLQQPTAPLRFYMVKRFCDFLKAAAASEEEDEEEQQQLQQFAAVSKLLIIAAAIQEELSLPERSHGYQHCSQYAEFVREFLYAPLRLYCSQVVAGLQQANNLLLLEQEKGEKGRQKQQQLLQLIDGTELADVFDGKLLVSLIGLAAAAARASGNWNISAESLGISTGLIKRIEKIWQMCSDGDEKTVLSKGFFPISLECLKELLSNPSSLPAPGGLHRDSETSAHIKQPINLLALPSTFLQRLRAGGPPRGALPDVMIVEDAEEIQLAEHEMKQQILLQRQLHIQQETGSDTEETEAGATAASDSEDEAHMNERDAEMLDMVLELRGHVNEQRRSGFEPCFRDAAADILQETLAFDETRVPSPQEIQKMEKMNGEEKKRYWEARQRRRLQQNLKHITRIAKCICPHPLHFNVFVNHHNHPWRLAEEKEKEVAAASDCAAASGRDKRQEAESKGTTTSLKKDKKEKPVVMKKADLIRARNLESKQQRAQDIDSERAENMESILEALCADKSGLPKSKNEIISEVLFKGRLYALTPSSLKDLMLDALIGSGRRMDLLLGLPAVTRALKTRERQKDFSMIVHGLVNNVYKGFTKEKCATKEAFLEIRRVLCLLFRFNIEIARLYGPQLSGPDIQRIQRSLLALGFTNTSERVFEAWLKQQEKQRILKNSISPPPPSRGKAKKTITGGSKTVEDDESYRVSSAEAFDFRISEGQEAVAQLRFMGGDFERSTRPPSLPPDTRVLFEADYWQSRLFDAVDSYASAFVSAPTASGKTYVCFYAMELVLRDSNEGCVVYVCPNKALAQQVYAEIYGRFSSKSYPVNCKKILSAQVLQRICTPKALEAQVLVTIPHYLELLLMSGHHREFCGNLKYVILDEVHCIAEQEEGSKWERIIQLLPCPFLAMSATVGNAESFLAWMRRSSPRTDIRYVSHMERFSDLHMHVYDEHHIIPLNPVAALHYNKIAEEGLAKDFYVPPQDGLQFYYCASRMLGSKHPFTEMFAPELYFEGTAAITKKQYRFYWQTMRDCFVSLIRNTKEVTLEMFAEIQQQLQESRPSWIDDLSLFASLPALKPQIAASAAAASRGKKYAGCLRAMKNRDVFAKAYLDPEKLLALFRTLNSRQLLPCLVFNFFRPQVRRMGASLSELLERLQWNKYYGTEEAAYRTRALNKQRMEEYEALLAEREMLRRMRGMSRQQRDSQGLDRQDLAALEEEDEIPPPPGDIADEIDDEFSFANPKAMGTNFDDIKAVLKEVRARGTTKQDELLSKLLERGVGLFDDGLSKSYRVAVELLYRWGFLRIIICTHALALGMNLPCKSAVFAGDALALTPTMFKQAGGRAGRRGYDSAGHIIFWEVPFRRINRLLEARLPMFSGDFPVTPMLALRTLRLNSQLEASAATDEYLEDRLNRLFLNPLFSVSGTNHLPAEQELQMLRFYVRYHIRFTADLLLRSGVLTRFSLGASEDCALNKFGYATELLYENGSGALILHFLLMGGTLEALTGQGHLSQGEKAQLLLQFLAVCFDINNGNEVSSNFVLQQLVHHRRDIARYKARQFAIAIDDEALAASIPAAAPQLKSDIKPFTKRFPPPIEVAIGAFNRMALSATASCLQAASSVVEEKIGKTKQDFTMPFTGLAFQSKPTESHDKPRNAQDGSLLGCYHQTVRAYSLQSPFAALGCLDDSEASLSCEILHDNLRETLPFQPEVMSAVTPLKVEKIPVLDVAAKRSVLVEVYRKNSYLQDLYAHGNLTRLVKEYGIAPENFWKLLQHFVGSLHHLQSGLKVIIAGEEDTEAPIHQLSAMVEALHKKMAKVLKAIEA